MYLLLHIYIQTLVKQLNQAIRTKLVAITCVGNVCKLLTTAG